MRGARQCCPIWVGFPQRSRLSVFFMVSFLFRGARAPHRPSDDRHRPSDDRHRPSDDRHRPTHNHRNQYDRSITSLIDSTTSCGWLR